MSVLLASAAVEGLVEGLVGGVAEALGKKGAQQIIQKIKRPEDEPTPPKTPLEEALAKMSLPKPLTKETDALLYRYNVSPIPHGRADETETLKTFLDGGQGADEQVNVKFCIITGAGGTGKSKLVYEFMRNSDAHQGWRTGVFVPEKHRKLAPIGR